MFLIYWIPPVAKKKQTNEKFGRGGCDLKDGFHCSKPNIKRCKASPNIKKIRQYCFAMRGHDDLMQELQNIFEEEIEKRAPRSVVALEEGYVSQASFEEGED